jgi:hypothetical protein
MSVILTVVHLGLVVQERALLSPGMISLRDTSKESNMRSIDGIVGSGPLGPFGAAVVSLPQPVDMRTPS